MSRSHPSLVHALLAGAALPALAAAQSAPAAVSWGSVATGLKAGTWSYQSRAQVNGQQQEFGTRSVVLQKGATAGEWLLLDAQTNAMATSSDSLVLSAADLSASKRAMHMQLPMGTASLALRFTADSVVGSVEAPGQSQPIAARNVAGALSNDAVLLFGLGRLPLAPGWTARVDMLNPMQGGVVPITLAVTGSEKVTVPAGAFDAWVVTVSGGPIASTLYVAKNGGPVVRSVAQVPQIGTVETVLTK